jgi:hypothetical protein
MSSAVMERIAEERPKLDLISTKPAPKVQEEAGQSDPHPLIPVFVAGAVSLILSITFIGSNPGAAGAAPFRSHGALSAAVVITASAHPMPTIPVVQSAA